ncbi:MAG: peptidylprolyl isomerase [bacterium]|nr:peptidylprolyl isomerase [bacterium]
MKKLITIAALFFTITTIGFAAEEIIDQVVAQVGDEPVLETELIQAAYLEAQNAGIDIMSDESKLDSLKRNVLKTIVDFRILLEAAKKDTSIKVTESETKAQADDDYQKLLRQAGSETALAERFGSTTRKIRKNIEDNARNTMLVQRYTEAHLQNIRVSKADIERFWAEHKSEFNKIPASVRLANILISVKPADVARNAALHRADSLVKIARSGVEFAKLAKETSSDSLSAQSGGDLGEASRGTFLPEFEAASFRLTEGEISDPVETLYGFHIIQLHSKRGDKFHVSHILVSLQPTSVDIAAAKQLSSDIAEQLKSGAAFDSLAKALSHDVETGSKGGDMGWFEASRIPAQFADRVKKLKGGEWTGPFDYRGGWHFLKVVERRDERMPDLLLDWDRIERLTQANARADRYRRLVDEIRTTVFVKYLNQP